MALMDLRNSIGNPIIFTMIFLAIFPIAKNIIAELKELIKIVKSDRIEPQQT
jgi:hypothetical protein